MQGGLKRLLIDVAPCRLILMLSATYVNTVPSLYYTVHFTSSHRVHIGFTLSSRYVQLCASSLGRPAYQRHPDWKNWPARTRQHGMCVATAWRLAGPGQYDVLCVCCSTPRQCTNAADYYVIRCRRPASLRYPCHRFEVDFQQQQPKPLKQQPKPLNCQQQPTPLNCWRQPFSRGFCF
jgi:hypothetical protein